MLGGYLLEGLGCKLDWLQSGRLGGSLATLGVEEGCHMEEVKEREGLGTVVILGEAVDCLRGSWGFSQGRPGGKVGCWEGGLERKLERVGLETWATWAW